MDDDLETAYVVQTEHSACAQRTACVAMCCLATGVSGVLFFCVTDPSVVFLILVPSLLLLILFVPLAISSTSRATPAPSVAAP